MSWPCFFAPRSAFFTRHALYICFLFGCTHRKDSGFSRPSRRMCPSGLVQQGDSQHPSAWMCRRWKMPENLNTLLVHPLQLAGGVLVRHPQEKKSSSKRLLPHNDNLPFDSIVGNLSSPSNRRQVGRHYCTSALAVLTGKKPFPGLCVGRGSC